MTVLRGCAFGALTDAPYAPLVRAMRPALAALPDADLSYIMGSATEELLRLLPELAPPGLPQDGTGTSPRFPTPPGAAARGGPRRHWTSRGAAADPAGIEDLHRADAGTRTLAPSCPGSPAPSAWRS